MALKKAGLSNLFRKNLLIMYLEKGYQCYHFDCVADCYPDLDISGLLNKLSQLRGLYIVLCLMNMRFS